MSTPKSSTQTAPLGPESGESPGSPSRPQPSHDVQSVEGSDAPVKTDSDSGAENLTPADKERFAPLPKLEELADLDDDIEDSPMDILKRSLADAKSDSPTLMAGMSGPRYRSRPAKLGNEGLKLAIDILPRFRDYLEDLTTETGKKRDEMVREITGEVNKAFSRVKANPDALELKGLRVTVVQKMTQELDSATHTELQGIFSFLDDLEGWLGKAALEANVTEKRHLDLRDEINALEKEKLAWEEMGRQSSDALHALEKQHNESVIADMQEDMAIDLVNTTVDRLAKKAQQAARVTKRRLFEPWAPSPPDALTQLSQEVRGKIDNPVVEFQQRGRFEVQRVHFAEPDTPGLESRLPSSLDHAASELQDEDAKVASSVTENELKQTIKAKDGIIADLQAQLALVCAAQGPQSAGGGSLPFIKGTNDLKGFAESSAATPTYSYPQSPITSALHTAQSLHKQQEMIEFIRSLDNHTGQLQSTLKAYAAQEERNLVKITSLEDDLARGKLERERLEGLLEMKSKDMAVVLSAQGPLYANAIERVHGEIKEDSRKLGTQIEHNERVGIEVGIRKQILLSIQGQSGDLNNLVTFMKGLVNWFKTKNEQATSLQSELKGAQSDIISTYSPSTPGRPLSGRPLSARLSFRSNLAELTEEPSTVGSSAKESREQKLAALSLPAEADIREIKYMPLTLRVVDTTEVKYMPLSMRSVGTLVQRFVMNQFQAWQQVFMFNLALGRATIRYLKDKYSKRPGPARDFAIPWFPLEALLLVLYHFQVLITIQVYVASRRQRDIWLSANALTREYMLRSVRQQPAWLFIPGLDRDLVLGGQEFGAILGQASYTVLLTASDLVRHFVVLLVHILVDPNWKPRGRAAAAAAAAAGATP
ncbi:hypothetical protein EDB81DRAFT_7731 [Dactylonectria macrodidyma]|uniref:Uncharacterized protein n=1 Tax=Dactylonectria macrodidyma TaxID=307937 RepID=A0A9P9FUA9_9HYPO|nr:hypothetical protein EDB81DRAFT_7731 [Dactylonectria macrodidyma]